MPLDAVIIGAGITSLSIATELSRRGYKLGIVAKDLPEDGQSVGFASPWAVGCLSLSLAHAVVADTGIENRDAIGARTRVSSRGIGKGKKTKS
jgi:glycine/D-amino acid oxidase-like deaminating enzyme